MPTNRRQRMFEKEAARRESLVDGLSRSLRGRFPNATRWVIFSAIGAQREAGDGTPSERLRLVEEAYDRFLATGEFSVSEDVKTAEAGGAELEDILSAFYDEHRWSTGPLCPVEAKGFCGGEASPVGHEYFYTE